MSRNQKRVKRASPQAQLPKQPHQPTRKARPARNWMAFETQTGLFEHDDYTGTFYTPFSLPFTPFPDHIHGHGHSIMSDRLDTHNSGVSTFSQPRLLHPSSSCASQSHSSASSSSTGNAGDSSPIEPTFVHTHAQRTLTVSPLSSTSNSSASENDEDDDAAAGQGNKAARKAPNSRLKGVTKQSTTRTTKPRVLKEDKREAKIIKERDRRAKLQERFTELADALDLDEEVRCDRLKLLSESITLIRLMKEEIQSLRRESDTFQPQPQPQPHVPSQLQVLPQMQGQAQAQTQGQGFMQAFNMTMSSAAYPYDPIARHALSLDAHTEIAPFFFPETADLFPSASSGLTFHAIHPAQIIQQQPPQQQQQQQQRGNALPRNLGVHANSGMINRAYIHPAQLQPAQSAAPPTPAAAVPIQRAPARRHKFSS